MQTEQGRVYSCLVSTSSSSFLSGVLGKSFYFLNCHRRKMQLTCVTINSREESDIFFNPLNPNPKSSFSFRSLLMPAHICHIKTANVIAQPRVVIHSGTYRYIQRQRGLTYTCTVCQLKPVVFVIVWFCKSLQLALHNLLLTQRPFATFGR